MSPIALFLHADIVVKVVMIGLILASIWTWTIIVGQWMRMRRAMKRDRLARQLREQGGSSDVDINSIDAREADKHYTA